jgi:hypothetical protein
VREVFDVELERLLPGRAPKLKRTLADMGDGRLNDVRFGDRMRGSGARWDAIEQLFELHVRRLGLNRRELDQPERKPRGQLSLF